LSGAKFLHVLFGKDLVTRGNSFSHQRGLVAAS
jgi:hypothetical protein